MGSQKMDLNYTSAYSLSMHPAIYLSLYFTISFSAIFSCPFKDKFLHLEGPFSNRRVVSYLKK